MATTETVALIHLQRHPSGGIYQSGEHGLRSERVTKERSGGRAGALRHQSSEVAVLQQLAARHRRTDGVQHHVPDSDDRILAQVLVPCIRHEP